MLYLLKIEYNTIEINEEKNNDQNLDDDRKNFYNILKQLKTMESQKEDENLVLFKEISLQFHKKDILNNFSSLKALSFSSYYSGVCKFCKESDIDNFGYKQERVFGGYFKLDGNSITEKNSLENLLNLILIDLKHLMINFVVFVEKKKEKK